MCEDVLNLYKEKYGKEIEAKYMEEYQEKNYMIHHLKMRILYVIDVGGQDIYLLNAMPKDTLRVILYIKFVI
tara:strand:- start:366 stop:581 length:216 start_codon:yes stop_codon:yes gene_type:complete